MRAFKIGRHVVPLWLVAVILVSLFGSVLGYYVWKTLSIPLEVKEPIEILNYPSQLSLYPGETLEFNVTVENHATVNYSVLVNYHLSNTTYQTSYVTFSNDIYTVVPGQQNLSAWVNITPDAPAVNESLTINFSRGVYPYGLVGYWKLDEGSGAIAYDSSGNNNHAVLTNGPVWTYGMYGEALSFDGTDDYLYVSNSSSLDITQAVTVACWAKVTGTTGDFLVMGSHDFNAQQKCYVIEYQPDGMTSRFTVYTSNGTTEYISSNTQVPIGQWAHVVGVFDGNTLKIYVNGVLTGQNSLTGTLDVLNKPLVIGCHQYLSHRNWFKGLIDNFMIFNRALSEEEIQAQYTTPLP